MVEPLGSPEPKPRSFRFDRIEIWRNEVAASRICCVCSAPTMGNAREIALAVAAIGGSSKAKTGLFKDTTPHLGSRGRSSLSHEPTGDCLVCAAPTDGVEYKWISRDGRGLVRAESMSLSPVTRSLKNLELGEESKWQWKGKLILKKVSRVFRSTKLASALPETGVGMSKLSIATTSPPPNQGHKRTGTEMYHSLRYDPEPCGTANKDERETNQRVSSDDDRTEPKTGIDKSAARLRRAQKLLDAQIQRTSGSPKS
ncbi:hypothetical protein F5Y10DRAFT_232157 [Nemania abortiva]|nr:hypothetical protein F5Y10DRAFT_232157 [Nemania abortiva]